MPESSLSGYRPVTREEIKAIQRAIDWSNEPGNSVFTTWDGRVVREARAGQFIPAGGMVVIGADGLAYPYGSFRVTHYCGTDWSYEAAVFSGRQLALGKSYAFRRRTFWEEIQYVVGWAD